MVSESLMFVIASPAEIWQGEIADQAEQLLSARSTRPFTRTAINCLLILLSIYGPHSFLKQNSHGIADHRRVAADVEVSFLSFKVTCAQKIGHSAVKSATRRFLATDTNRNVDCPGSDLSIESLQEF